MSMSLFQRLFKIGQAEAHALVDKFEDPIKQTEQGIRDMRKALGDSVKSLAETKAGATLAKREFEDAGRQVREYAGSAEKLLQDPTKKELVQRAVVEANRIKDSLPVLKKSMEIQTSNVTRLEDDVMKLQTTIADWERKLGTLKARQKAATASKKINGERAKVDVSGTLAMLERMEQKVLTEEAEAEALGEIADKLDEPKNLEEELRQALPGPSAETGGEDLKSQIEALKQQLG